MVLKVNRSFGVNLVGYATSPLGLGEELRQAARGFLNAGIRINIINIEASGTSALYSDLDGYIGNEFLYPVSIFFLSPFSFSRYYDKNSDSFKETYVIGSFFWELEDFPSKWVPVLSLVDEIWVSTKFVWDIYKKCGVKTVRTNPTPAITPPTNAFSFRNEFSFCDRTFVFGFMFDLHSSLKRKNPLALVKAYEQCRRLTLANQPTALLIKVHRANVPSNEYEELKRYCSHVKGVHLYEETLDAEGVVGFYNTVDAYVSLHRSEGLGRTIIEARQLGLPTVCTAYSGATDIIELSDVLGVPYELIACAPGDYPNCDESVWAEASVEYASEVMAYLVSRGRLRYPPPDRLNSHFSESGFVERSITRFRDIGFDV